ncbi:NADPH:quinone reductase [Neobacillus vireti]|uniref:Quinone oxidoreductase n=1 Tax=Neobacillus vireti LMG 21834 TaxID=1131730 RepID=A0AB94IP49_9BACI|nr:NADPH:quinone reductase [Neobacillus vireti]ETI68834.1 quinone oxidoreductase [Neobacillus vireti LMG 21834]KLT19616.1 quinone oxidoreductase [Neobacillus vireti]
MKAIQMSSFGEPEVLKLVEVNEPAPAENEVRVRLYHAGVNPAEAYIRAGGYAFFSPDMPYISGFDGAGVVDEVGPGVTRLEAGDRVFVASTMAKRKTGTYAEKVVCDVEAVHKLPESVSFEQGAALGIPVTAAYRALFHRAHLKPGETVLVHGASGGVGTLAVQLAKYAGAKVIGTAGTEESMDIVRKSGADAVLNHNQSGYLEAIPSITNGAGVDVVIEMLANVNLEEDLKLINKFGRVVVIGNRGSLDFNPRLTMAKEADVLGMAVWNAPLDEFNESLIAVEAALKNGGLQPFVGTILPLEEAANAHIQILSSNAKGKMVLEIGKK